MLGMEADDAKRNRDSKRVRAPGTHDVHLTAADADWKRRPHLLFDGARFFETRVRRAGSLFLSLGMHLWGVFSQQAVTMSREAGA